MKGIKLVDFDILGGDERGSLVALEALSPKVPFEIKRVYYMFGVNSGITRGKHAHYKLKQVLICVSGSVDLVLDDGKSKEVVCLNSPSKGLYIDSFIWREMKNFSKDAVLLVLASDHYEVADYVRDYDKFLREVIR